MFESKMPEMPYSKSKETDLNQDSESHKIEHISKSETKPKVITDKNTDKKKKIEAKLKNILELEQERRNFGEPPYQIKEQTTDQGHTYPVLETKRQNLDFDDLNKLFHKTFVQPS